MDEYHQQHIQKGVTHWIAWMCDSDMPELMKEGWSVVKTYTLVLVRNKDGVLVEPHSLSVKPGR